MQWKRGKARDPVCGAYVDPERAETRKVQDVTYYFCNKECADEFERKTTISAKEPASSAFPVRDNAHSSPDYPQGRVME